MMNRSLRHEVKSNISKRILILAVFALSSISCDRFESIYVRAELIPPDSESAVGRVTMGPARLLADDVRSSLIERHFRPSKSTVFYSHPAYSTKEIFASLKRGVIHVGIFLEEDGRGVQIYLYNMDAWGENLDFKASYVSIIEDVESNEYVVRVHVHDSGVVVLEEDEQRYLSLLKETSGPE